MGELICVGDAVQGLFRMTNFAYEEKKRKILSSVNENMERVSNGMIYCRTCYQPKMADFPERHFVARCSCKCEVQRWERERKRLLNPPRIREIRQGDWNPFE